jgi:hypothetical protein
VTKTCLLLVAVIVIGMSGCWETDSGSGGGSSSGIDPTGVWDMCLSSCQDVYHRAVFEIAGDGTFYVLGLNDSRGSLPEGQWKMHGVEIELTYSSRFCDYSPCYHIVTGTIAGNSFSGSYSYTTGAITPGTKTEPMTGTRR